MSLTLTDGMGDSGGGGAGVLSVVSIDNSTPSLLVINFNSTVIPTGTVLNASSWSIIGEAPMTVTSVGYSGSSITLTVTPGTDGVTYTLNLPQTGIIRQSDSAPLTPPYQINFTATGVSPSVLLIASDNDARTFDVVFTKNVIELDALNEGNYSISPTLQVVKSSKIHDSRYRIKTKQAQSPGVIYTVTVSNVRDTYGNLI